jgi:Ni,Fe-hydrogenase maturation factor
MIYIFFGKVFIIGTTIKIMKTVLCFGNPYIENDSLAIAIAKELKIKDVKFEICLNPQKILEYKNKNLYILDVVQGIHNVKLINNVDMLAKSKSLTPHDFDLAFFLKLMKQLGKINNICIIGMPMNYDKEKAKNEIKAIICKKQKSL